MRKICIILITLALFPLTLCAEKKSHAQQSKGYFCDAGVSFGATFPKGEDPRAVVEVFTTHGYQFSKIFSLGAGIATYNTETFNVYMQLRFNLKHTTETRSHYPFIALRGGYSWSTWTGESFGDDKGPIVDPHLGWSFYTPQANLRWSVFAAPSLYQWHFIPKVGLAFEF